ncbi:MAG: hypothetical protein HZA52_21800 [Planctomycetes bacterium]|nr:hypothetical protein [Planctomycetota bacterium]
MGVSWSELRRVCQTPVRDTNDVAGLLYGDHASLPITKLMVDLRLSPDLASIGFFVCGLTGAVLQATSGVLAAVASALLVLYYVLDCVDGEVARFQRVCDVKWGYFDFLFHMLVKPLVFCGVAVGLWRETGAAWPIFAAFAASTATLWLKLFLETPGIVFLKEFLRRSRKADFIAETARPMVDRAKEVELGAPDHGGYEGTEDTAGTGSTGAPFRLRLDRVTARALMTNFDIGLVLLLAATLADLAVAPFDVPVLGPVGFRGAWIAYYGIILPLDFADYLRTYLLKGHFNREVTRLLALAHHFSLDSRRER